MDNKHSDLFKNYWDRREKLKNEVFEALKRNPLPQEDDSGEQKCQ